MSLLSAKSLPSTARVGIFWDYENCALPSVVSGYTVVDNIRKLALPYGHITSFKAYLELSDTPSLKPLSIRSELQTSGVSLIDCPHNGRKDVADKMMIADMLIFALDNPAPAVVILISGDRDFAYVVSTLRHRGYTVPIIVPAASHIALKAQASRVFHWVDVASGPSNSPNIEADVLCQSPQEIRASVTPPLPMRRPSRRSITTSDGEAVYYRPTQPVSPTTQLLQSTLNNTEAIRLADRSPPRTLPTRSSPPRTTPPRSSFSTTDTRRSRSETLSSVNEIDEHHALPTENIPCWTFGDVPPSRAFSPTPMPITSAPTCFDTNQNPTFPDSHRAWVWQGKAKEVAPHFETLLELLDENRKAGVLAPLRSAIGMALTQRDPLVYVKAGVSRFKEYVAMAEEAGLVLLGGPKAGGEYIVLLVSREGEEV